MVYHYLPLFTVPRTGARVLPLIGDPELRNVLLHFISMRRVLAGVFSWRSMPLGSLLLAAVLLVNDPEAGGASQATYGSGFEARSYNGSYNNLGYPLWGSTNITQVSNF